MDYSVYKLTFPNGVHFGNGMLNDSDLTLKSDTLFSALCTEAAKCNMIGELVSLAQNDKLFLTDMFPYYKEKYMIPKPMLYIEGKNKGDSIQKKKVKKLKFIAIDELSDYLKGNIDSVENYLGKTGKFNMTTKASINGEEETLPYHVGEYRFSNESGLYFISVIEDGNDIIDKLIESLSYSGIGGKRSSGLGRFICKKVNMKENFLKKISLYNDVKTETKETEYMLLSTAMTADEKILDEIIENASYSLIKRSGFISSETFNDTNIKKKEIYLFQSGSCFKDKFKGDIFDISPYKGNHPVYRYAKSIFMEVR